MDCKLTMFGGEISAKGITSSPPSVCDNSKSTGCICTKFGRKVRHRPAKKWLNFWAVQP